MFANFVTVYVCKLMQTVTKKRAQCMNGSYFNLTLPDHNAQYGYLTYSVSLFDLF